ncbi:hypothetical protein FOZ63_009388, partial [Perkinsus olseni]
LHNVTVLPWDAARAGFNRDLPSGKGLQAKRVMAQHLAARERRPTERYNAKLNGNGSVMAVAESRRTSSGKSEDMFAQSVRGCADTVRKISDAVNSSKFIRELIGNSELE